MKWEIWEDPEDNSWTLIPAGRSHYCGPLAIMRKAFEAKDQDAASQVFYDFRGLGKYTPQAKESKL